MIFDRWRGRWQGTAGTPRSANGASSLHLQWMVDAAPPGRAWIAAEAVIEVLVPPRVPALSFWALQASFVDRGRHAGAGHLGLQWHAPHPDHTAVNWGGYDASGRELVGSPSSLPSATGNVNTRDYSWAPSRAYRLRISRAESEGADPPPAGLVAWRGEVRELTGGATTVVRDLWAAGTALDSPMVWSEVFARCDDPLAQVRWSDLRLVDDAGDVETVAAVRVNYQTLADGGCRTSDSSVDSVGVVQTTGTTRTNATGAVLSLPQVDRS